MYGDRFGEFVSGYRGLKGQEWPATNIISSKISPCNNKFRSHKKIENDHKILINKHILPISDKNMQGDICMWQEEPTILHVIITHASRM